MLQKAPSASIQCQTCPARRDGLCTELSPSDLALMQKFKCGDRAIKAGQDIFAAGQPCEAIYNLTDGWAFRYTLLEDGRRQILDFALPGAVLGFHPAKGARATYGVQALTDANVCIIRHPDLAALSREVPQTGLRLAWLIARDRSLAYDHLTSVGRQSAHQRVAHLILELFVRCRAQWPGQRIEQMLLPLTQEHIGDATGLTSVHVNRVLRDLRQERVLEFHYRRLRILNPDKLIDVAETDPHLMMSWTGTPVPRDGAEPAAAAVKRPAHRSERPHLSQARGGGASMIADARPFVEPPFQFA